MGWQVFLFIEQDMNHDPIMAHGLYTQVQKWTNNGAGSSDFCLQREWQDLPESACKPLAKLLNTIGKGGMWPKAIFGVRVLFVPRRGASAI